MITTLSKTGFIASATLSLFASGAAFANPDVTSREYKLLLNPALFTYTTESVQVNSYFSSFVTAVEAKIARDVSGSLSRDKI